MDSNDDLPPLEPINIQPNYPGTSSFVSNGIAIFVSREQEPSLRVARPERSLEGSTDDIGELESSSGEEMPELMSVSTSSDEGEPYNGEDDDESEWSLEQEDDFYTDEDMPTLERLIPGQPDAPMREELYISRSDQPARAQSFTSIPGSPELPGHEQGRHGERLPEVISFDFLETLFNSLPNELIDRADEAIDPERAKTLVDGLEKLPTGLLQRMIRVGGAPGAYEDANDDENITYGCAICWLSLYTDEENQVVSLPCAHVFHSMCLLPWFSRKTSCPICRFNIDPQSLTRTSRTVSYNQSQQPGGSDRALEEQEELPRLHSFLHEINQLMETFRFNGSENPTTGQSAFQIRGYLTVDREGIEARLSRLDPSVVFSHSKPTWTVPDCPGLSLREIIESKEREQELRCFDKACIFAPTDNNPYSEEARIMRQISIQLEEAPIGTCEHRVHPACLVLSTRRASKTPSVHAFENMVKVRCPSCDSAGAVTEEDWREGELSLEVC